MGDLEDLKSEIGAIISSKWDSRDGLQVPEPDDIQLGNTAVKLEATVLYADLVESTALVNRFPDWFAAEIYKCFLKAACRLILRNGGEITAFDGDRVMAVYIGDSKNGQAVSTALELKYAVDEVIHPMIGAQYPDSKFQLRHVAGVDTSPLFVARTGVRGSNDLVWVGRAANYAAKLSSLRAGYATWITTDVYERLPAGVKRAKGGAGESMWERGSWKDHEIEIYCSNWRLSLD